MVEQKQINKLVKGNVSGWSWLTFYIDLLDLEVINHKLMLKLTWMSVAKVQNGILGSC